MHRLTLSPLVLALLICANGCATQHKHAEVPDFTEKGWSEPNPEYTHAKVDTPIQPTQAPIEVASTAPPDPPTTAAAPEPTKKSGKKKHGKRKPPGH